MENSYKVNRDSPNHATVNGIDGPIIIEENEITRKVLFVDLNNSKIEKGETVGVTIVHQRKGKNDNWEDAPSINLNSLKGGEGVKLKLNSNNTKKIYDELTKLYKIGNENVIPYGTQDYTIAKESEIIKVSKDRKKLIEQLLSENYGEEVWTELTSKNPDLATKLSLAKIQTDRVKVLETFKTNLDLENSNESFWQKFFSENDWIFGYGLNYQFLHLLQEQPNYGGVDFTGKGTQRGDYLLNTVANVKFTVLVEIKTPNAKLLTYKESRPKNIRNDVWLLSSALIGAISQIQVNCRTWGYNSQERKNNRNLEKDGIYTVEPKGILIIGNTKEFSENESIISCFENFRRNINNPEIITFDELYERVKFIVDNETKKSVKINR